MRRAVTLTLVDLNVKLSTKYVCQALCGDMQGGGVVSGANNQYENKRLSRS
jgi:hypothetical protein